jgi:hypothetical protein
MDYVMILCVLAFLEAHVEKFVIKKLLKVHKIDNFFSFGFEFCTVSLLVVLKYEGFIKETF